MSGTRLPHLSPVPKPHVKCSESMSLFSFTLTDLKSFSCISAVFIRAIRVALKCLDAGMDGEAGVASLAPLCLGRCAHLELVARTTEQKRLDGILLRVPKFFYPIDL